MIDDGDEGRAESAPAMSFANRLSELQRHLGKNQKEFSDAAGVPLSTMKTWIGGVSDPPFVRVAEMAAKLGVSLLWLAYGRGPLRIFPPGDPASAHLASAVDDLRAQRAAPQGQLDEELLTTVLTAIEEHLAELGLTLAPAKKAGVVALLYSSAVQAGPGRPKQIDPDAARRLLRLVS